MANKKEKDIIKTYYYDYHQLKLSLQTSQILLDSYKLEIDELLFKNDKNKALINQIKTKIKIRENIIQHQKELLQKMEDVINEFPEHLKKMEFKVWEKSAIENKNTDEIARELIIVPEYVRRLKSRVQEDFCSYLKLIDKGLN